MRNGESRRLSEWVGDFGGGVALALFRCALRELCSEKHNTRVYKAFTTLWPTAHQSPTGRRTLGNRRPRTGRPPEGHLVRGQGK